MADSLSPGRRGNGGGKPNKDRTVAEIEKLARQRANRRKSAHEFKKKREHEIKMNEKKGRPGDVDFQRMIRRFRKRAMNPAQEHSASGMLKINVVVRKRPVSESEIARKDYDSVSCSNPCVYVHHCKLKVDGITKFLDNVNFQLDHAFNEFSDNQEVYEHTAKGLVNFAVDGGRATCFAYGQTGSGKTFTMAGVQGLAARDVFRLVNSSEHIDKGLEVYCAFFELYGGRCIDLLHDRRVCSIREDGKGRVQVEGLQEIIVSDEDELLQLIERGNGVRTTHATEMNSDSSRSHAICQIALRKLSSRAGSEPFGKLSLIDLAGSERGQDTKHHNRQRRGESAEINKSLLALKECVRALDSGSSHVPYRTSKLTMILKDSFSSNARTVMISCVSPVASSADHTLNTLRYADRIKEKAVRPLVQRPSITNGDLSDVSCSDSEFDSADGKEEESRDFDDEEEDSELSMARRSSPPPPTPDASEDKAKNRKQKQQQQARDLVQAKRLTTQLQRHTPAKASAASPAPPGSNYKQQQRRGRPTPRISPSPKYPNEASASETRSEHSSGSNVMHKLSSASSSSTSGSESSRKPPSSIQAPGSSSKAGRGSGVTKIQAPSSRRKQWEDPAKNPPKLREPLQSQNHSNVHNSKIGNKSSSNQREESPEVVNFHDVVAKLVDMEEDVLSAHMKTIQKNADLLTEEGVLLSKVQGSDVVDYDIEEYAERLDAIVSSKLKMFQDLHAKVTRFRKHLEMDGVAQKLVQD
ncbi:Diatom spindle kinesin-1 [Durusdinium trenchii]|uniref:Kinesin-like protein n=1 Tax=Durusdinium trenchii TaxID=1381693 RepID=A0ABP0JCP1_9DINO